VFKGSDEIVVTSMDPEGGEPRGFNLGCQLMMVQNLEMLLCMKDIHLVATLMKRDFMVNLEGIGDIELLVEPSPY